MVKCNRADSRNSGAHFQGSAMSQKIVGGVVPRPFSSVHNLQLHNPQLPRCQETPQHQKASTHQSTAQDVGRRADLVGLLHSHSLGYSHLGYPQSSAKVSLWSHALPSTLSRPHIHFTRRRQSRPLCGWRRQSVFLPLPPRLPLLRVRGRPRCRENTEMPPKVNSTARCSQTFPKPRPMGSFSAMVESRISSHLHFSIHHIPSATLSLSHLAVRGLMTSQLLLFPASRVRQPRKMCQSLLSPRAPALVGPVSRFSTGAWRVPIGVCRHCLEGAHDSVACLDPPIGSKHVTTKLRSHCLPRRPFPSPAD